MGVTYIGVTGEGCDIVSHLFSPDGAHRDLFSDTINGHNTFPIHQRPSHQKLNHKANGTRSTRPTRRAEERTRVRTGSIRLFAGQQQGRTSHIRPMSSWPVGRHAIELHLFLQYPLANGTTEAVARVRTVSTECTGIKFKNDERPCTSADFGNCEIITTAGLAEIQGGPDCALARSDPGRRDGNVPALPGAVPPQRKRTPHYIGY